MSIPYDKLPPVPAGHTVLGPLSDPFFPEDGSALPTSAYLCCMCTRGDTWEYGSWRNRSIPGGYTADYIALPNDHEMVARWKEAHKTEWPVSTKYRTSDGHPVIIITESGPCPMYPIIGCVVSGSSYDCRTWTADGRFIVDESFSGSDLIPIPESRNEIHVDPATNAILESPTETSVRYVLP